MPGDAPDDQDSAPEPFHLRQALTRRRFLITSALSAGGFGLYANQISRHEIDTTHRNIAIRNLPSEFAGFRIVQISDLHLEEFTEEYFLRRVVAHVNAIAPDAVLVSGDFITDSMKRVKALDAAVRCAEILSGLNCPIRLGCLGNHDALVGGPQIIERIRPSGVKILVNKRVPIERGSRRLWIAALDDGAHGHPKMDLAVPSKADGPLILMAHEPDFGVDVIERHPNSQLVDLVLSGHSHGGQVRYPWGTPPTLPPGAETYYEGLYHVGNMQLYVNRGIGTVGVPFRLNCPPEITIHTLRPA